MIVLKSMGPMGEKEIRLGVGTHKVCLLVWCEGQETKAVNPNNSPIDVTS